MPRYQIAYTEELIHKITIEADSDAHAQKFLDYLLDGAIEPEDADRAETLFEGVTHGSCTSERLDTYLVDYDDRLEIAS